MASGVRVTEPVGARLDLGLATLGVSVARGVGPGFDLQLPLGALSIDDGTGPRASVGLGDLETRARWLFRPHPKLALQLGAGAAWPTGPYVARSGLAAFAQSAQYLTLGRGAVWGLGDVELRWTLPARFGLFAQATLRAPFGPASDGFRWGTELRSAAGLSLGPLGDRLSLSVAFEAQWRHASEEVDPFVSALVPSVNTGGWWWTVLPAAVVRLTPGLWLSLAARVPVGQVVNGLQFVPALGAFVGLSGVVELGERTAQPGAPERGRVTIVEYGARWCQPCQKLEPLLEAFAQRKPNVGLRRIDASDWSAEQLEAAVPGAGGLPIVEVYRADGRRSARLVGEAVFGFEAAVAEAER